MSDPVEAAAWTAALQRSLPDPPSAVLDVGAGTGALSLIAAGSGYAVTAVDLSEGMLSRARAKAAQRGLEIDFRVGPAEDPPQGPFDAVMERHVLWTIPDPELALAAWRRVTRPGGRLVLLEGSWGDEGPAGRVRRATADLVRKARGIPHDHHGAYPKEVLEALPLRATTSPAPFLRAVERSGWRAARIHRLRDVEWAIERREPWPLGALERHPRYAIVAEA